MSKTFPEKIDKIFDVRFSSIFLFIAVSGCLSAMGVQTHYKKPFAKKIVSTKLYKKLDQKSKTDFLDFCLSRC
jgi:hypothetical protein